VWAPHRLTPESGRDNSGEQKVVKDATSAETAPRGVAWDFSKIPSFHPQRANRPEPSFRRAATLIPGALQAKLVVGRANDPLEQEADRVADQVMCTPRPDLSVTSSPRQVNRKCGPCEEEAQMLQTKPGRSSEAAPGAAPSVIHEVLRSPGQPLDSDTRNFFEPRFGQDFSKVRIHADRPAVAAARDIAARAFTVGEHIVFGGGQYAPNGPAGQQLLAHELAHTVQQQQIAPATPTILREPDPQPAAQPGRRWDFTGIDLIHLRESGRTLTIAPDSSFFPARMQENLLQTLLYVMGPAILPPAAEGINAVDFFHGHLVVKKDPAEAKLATKYLEASTARRAAEDEADKAEPANAKAAKAAAAKAKADAKAAKAAAETAKPAIVKAAEAKGTQFDEQLTAKRTKALGGRVQWVTGYPFDPADPSTPHKIGAYQKAVEKLLPSFGTLLEETSKLPGAAIMYHTFESTQPRDLKAKGETLASENPRRHYVTPLDTNRPRQYTPPSVGYEGEYTVIAPFSFLVDEKGAVHIRPFSAGASGFKTLELSTITGTPFADLSKEQL
jgi:hypothetical protein